MACSSALPAVLQDRRCPSRKMAILCSASSDISFVRVISRALSKNDERRQQPKERRTDTKTCDDNFRFTLVPQDSWMRTERQLRSLGPSRRDVAALQLATECWSGVGRQVLHNILAFYHTQCVRRDSRQTPASLGVLRSETRERHGNGSARQLVKLFFLSRQG